MAKFRRKNNTYVVLLLSILITYLFRIILVKIFGSTGMSYFSIPNDFYFLFAFSLSIGLEQGITSLVEVRMARGSYESVKRMIKGGLFISLVISLFIGIILFAFSRPICNRLYDIPLIRMSLLVMLISVPFTIFAGTFRGYFNGIGYRNLSTISYLIFAVLYFVFGLFFSGLWLDYGTKVSNLLRSENFKYTYATLGFSVALVLASLISFLYMFVLYVIYERRTVLNNKEYSKNQESFKETLALIIKNSYIASVISGCVFFVSFFDSLILLRRNEEVNSILFEYGECYSKSFPIVVISSIILYMFLNVYTKRAIGAVRKDEFRAARERLARLIHRAVTLSLFISGVIICCAENVLKILYPQNGRSTVSYVYILGIMVFLLSICFIFAYLLYELRYGFVLGIISVFSLIVHIIVALILTISDSTSVFGIIIADLIFYGLLGIGSFFIVCRAFQYTQEWFRTIVVSLIAALVTTLVGLLINNSLSKVVGYPLGMIISIIISIIIYMVILLLLRGYDEDELNESLSGKIMLSFGRLLHLI